MFFKVFVLDADPAIGVLLSLQYEGFEHDGVWFVRTERNAAELISELRLSAEFVDVQQITQEAYETALLNARKIVQPYPGLYH